MSKKVQFKSDSTAQVVEIANGEYRREFVRDEQPFELTNDEWRLARKCHDLEVVPEPAKDEGNGTETDTRKSEQ